MFNEVQQQQCNFTSGGWGVWCVCKFIPNFVKVERLFFTKL